MRYCVVSLFESEPVVTPLPVMFDELSMAVSEFVSDGAIPTGGPVIAERDGGIYVFQAVYLENDLGKASR